MPNFGSGYVPPVVKAMRNPTFEVSFDLPDLIFDEDVEAWERNDAVMAKVVAAEAQALGPGTYMYAEPPGVYMIPPPQRVDTPNGVFFQPQDPFQNQNPMFNSMPKGVVPGGLYAPGVLPSAGQLTTEQAAKLDEFKRWQEEITNQKQALNLKAAIEAELATTTRRVLNEKGMEYMRRQNPMMKRLARDSRAWTGINDSS